MTGILLLCVGLGLTGASCASEDGLGSDPFAGLDDGGNVLVPGSDGGVGVGTTDGGVTAGSTPDTSAWDPRSEAPGGADGPGSDAMGDRGLADGHEDLQRPEANYPPCIDNSDCTSGWCVDGYDGMVCSEFCTEECPSGWSCQGVQSPGRDIAWICMPKWLGICRPCDQSAECPTKNSVCASYGPSGSFCATACLDDEDCPQGYGCGGNLCLLDEGECTCDAAGAKAAASTECWSENELGTCTGDRMCTDDGLTPCSALEPAEESCDGLDNNCDGIVDEDTVGNPCEITNEHGTCPGTSTCEAATAGCDGVAPGPELCDGVDNNCDGQIDEVGGDLDGDGVTDCLDEDLDGDDVLNEEDNCPANANPAQSDTDVDGDGDACDSD
ncbi:MAG: thrombospondin type 3 repeat-containing protein, partial [Myxococcota bacterium]|nr:thrombospondin type 3 repeat-containing protein [Myxococcota bacterium]